MRFIANLEEVLENHRKWLNGDRDGKRANLSGANLRGASLFKVDLSGANLYGADLGGADLRGAILYVADLRRAYLHGVRLYGADLCGADLRGAYLGEVDLDGAKIDEATKAKAFPLCCPEEGSFIGWKKCDDGAIVKLQIPAAAKRSSAYGRKCRCSEAIVLAITDKYGRPLGMAKSNYDNKFVYRVGQIVRPAKPFEENRWVECASGIHFFMTKQEAIDY